jgi:flagellar assembly protein FliH
MNSSSSSKKAAPRGKVVRGRAASLASPERPSTTTVTPIGGIQLTTEVAEQLQTAGYEQGYERGFETGYAEGIARGEQETQRLCAQREQMLDERIVILQQAAQQFETVVAQAMEELEHLLPDAAFMLAEAIVGRELAVASNPGLDAIVRALNLAPQRVPVIARCNPNDVEHLGDLEHVLPGRTITIVADSTLRSGDCILEAERTEIDATMRAAIERVRKVMSE